MRHGRPLDAGMGCQAVKLTFVLRVMNGGMGECGRTTHFAATFASNDTEGWVLPLKGSIASNISPIGPMFTRPFFNYT